MAEALTQSGLFALLRAGHSVVVPGAHAAQTLRARFTAELISSPPAREPGTLLAWTEWTRSHWPKLIVDGREERVLLQRAQEDQLWADILGTRSAARAASAATAMSQEVKLAHSGLQLAASYNAVDRLRSTADNYDSRTFATWVDAFRDLCARQRLVSPAFLDATLAEHFRAGVLVSNEKLHLVGFEDFTPAQRDLLSSIRRTGTQVQVYALARESQMGSTGRSYVLSDVEEQLTFAVRWIVEQAKREPGSFAIISPHADEHRPTLERLLREYLAPELAGVGTDPSACPWHFADGPNLASVMITSHALALLRWVQQPLPLEAVGKVLLSPYFSYAESLEERCRFEAYTLRDKYLLRPELNLTEFLDLLAKVPRKHHLPRFPELRALARASDKRILGSAPRSHAEWADTVRAMLATAGWPGRRELRLQEAGAVEAWDEVLDRLASLDRNGRRLSFPRFLDQLEAEMASTTPSPVTAGAAIQILSLAQAEGIPFDHVLLLDATDRELPVVVRQHPLLPRRLQSSLGMPGGDVAQSLQRTRDQLLALNSRVSSLIMLAPAQDATGPLLLAPLAADLGMEPSEPSAALPCLVVGEPAALEEFPDPGQLPPLPSPAVQGGARVLELQAACGFRAFADLRLQADELQSPTLGLSSREAGSRLHDALHRLWKELKTQAQLRALASPARRSAVEAAVRDALQPLAQYPGAEHPWTVVFLDIVHQRYTDLLLHWLSLELDRAPFAVVASEQEELVTIGPLELKVRPDRLDKVSDGFVYIDYKTKSMLRPDDWLGERPDAPQLPLYTQLTHPGEVRGVAFGRLRPGKQLGWVSLTDRPGLFPGKGGGEHDLETEWQNWRSELTRLAHAFADGDTTVNPKKHLKTCEYCHFRLLCRLKPEDLLVGSGDTQDSEDDLGL